MARNSALKTAEPAALPTPRFTKLDAKGKDLPADATGHVAVRDNVSGLIWEAGDTGKQYTHAKAEKHVKGLKLLGEKDWRLPTVEELFLLADRSKRMPAIDTTFFPDCESSWYWTSTPAAWDPAVAAWVVGFLNCSANYSLRDSASSVRAVRSGQ
jgi:hypothetical protein